MNGLLIVNKDINITSRDVVNKLIKIFNTKRIGHTGTLDPIANGVLVCLIGKYTKLSNIITSEVKEYVAEIKLGIKTDTSDITGNAVDKCNVNLTNDLVVNTFNNFPKEYNQIVPIYSAVKINGKKLYEYARSNINIDLPNRLVHIYNLELLEYNNDYIKFKCTVSKGTYIRSLIEDICKSMNVVGTMSSLKRIKQGKFDIKESYTLKDIENNNYKLLSLKDIFDYPIIEIPDEYYRKIINGNSIPNTLNIHNRVIFTKEKQEIAIYENINNILKPIIMF